MLKTWTPVALALCAMLVACGGPRPWPADEPLVLTTVEPDPPLPHSREALLEEAALASADGPAGPDLPRALAAYQVLLLRDAGDLEAAWRALRVFYYRSIGASKKEIQRISERCMPLATRIMTLESPPEVMFYGALCMAARARVEDGKALVKEMRTWGQRALEKDPTVAYGGPDRLLGGIYLRAPAWPMSIGDIDKAIKHLQEAVRIAPEWPENHLLLAEAFAEDDEHAKAAAALERAETLMRAEEFGAWRNEWAQQAAAVRAAIADSNNRFIDYLIAVIARR